MLVETKELVDVALLKIVSLEMEGKWKEKLAMMG